MSTSSTRSTPSPTTLGTSGGASSPSQGKNFKIFNRHHARDRSKSLNESAQPAAGNYTSGSESAASTSAKRSPVAAVKRSRLFGVRERDERATASTMDLSSLADTSIDSPPTIVEPASPSTSNTSSDNYPSARPRPRPERPSTAGGDMSYSSSNSKISDIPSRLSGWFSHTFTGSTTDLSLPGLLSQTANMSASVPSPKSKASGLLTAARHGKGHLDKAMRYLLDSDATPDRSTEPIWLLGVSHPGYEPPPSPTTPPLQQAPQMHRRNSTDSRRSPRATLHSSSSSSSSSHMTQHQSLPPAVANIPPPASSQAPLSPTSKQAAAWPSAFYADFTSRVWVTYRSNFSPIHDCPLSACQGRDLESLDFPAPKRSFWPGAGEKTWTSDAGWGCMLRTGQSLLANTLVHLHLGREWRRPAINSASPDFATYVKLLTWFFDSPSTLAPFSVHRMAMSGKDLGKDVGQWFGPSTAAGAIKTLVHDFPRAQLSVAMAVDGVLYESDVYSASHHPRSSSDGPRRSSGFKRHAGKWGDRAVLVLVATRLGLDGVNPIYYENLKTIFTFPQSVGIAGGRPSSSYYFVGMQGNSLFYLDPHHARPAVPLRPPPPGDEDAPFPFPGTGSGMGSTITGLPRSSSASSSSFSLPYNERRRYDRHSSPPAETPSAAPSAFRAPTASVSPTTSTRSSSTQSVYDSDRRSSVVDDPLLVHYGLTYSMTDLRTYHCDRVRKMPLSGLDPSMLLGFLCRDEADWKDFRQRMAEISKGRDTLFPIQEEPPSWPSDSDDLGLESLSEPDIDMPPDSDEELADAPPEELVDSPMDERDESRILAGLDDEPQTPLPGARMRTSIPPKVQVTQDAMDEDEDDDEWVDPQEDFEPPQPAPPQQQAATKQRSPWPLATNGASGATTPTSNRVATAPSQSGPVQFPFPTSPVEGPAVADDEREARRSRRLSTKARTLDSAMLSKVSAHAQGIAPGAPIPDYSQVRSIRMRNGGRTKSGGVKGVFPIDDRSGDSS
ncbi:hypothetical protein EXIGLDRAFT_711000 [Exidia glandulosa HHB12029]|uniref:Autophagy-related protein 4 n=1 Tax=Exidia glandulosa HHB12029 TaxID=1314781 RepID=A0A165NFV7_EXIGL|nr:hypothetical protein EXIGLDRAFT_711000 [Exidia glandulosa HHB12029]